MLKSVADESHLMFAASSLPSTLSATVNSLAQSIDAGSVPLGNAYVLPASTCVNAGAILSFTSVLFNVASTLAILSVIIAFLASTATS